jgi:hypothetical protein
MNVTPEMDAPIIPKATRNQGDFLLPTKKDALSAPRLVITEIRISRPKYITTMRRSIQGFMIEILFENLRI